MSYSSGLDFFSPNQLQPLLKSTTILMALENAATSVHMEVNRVRNSAKNMPDAVSVYFVSFGSANVITGSLAEAKALEAN